ncbi:unnamed protein product [Heligmosomoides polygyrus]|uniref:Reverse transcriptase domain-containing protein n=1 Tax=Heligmosomoides polygyrus TaxID=6339 RepID=A0A183F4H4_HELPZ|nr:unnamed protein product [Heligmosomoides polygyrus]
MVIKIRKPPKEIYSNRNPAGWGTRHAKKTATPLQFAAREHWNAAKDLHFGYETEQQPDGPNMRDVVSGVRKRVAVVVVVVDMLLEKEEMKRKSLNEAAS